MKHAHWNVKRPNPIALRGWLDHVGEFVTAVEVYVCQTAERIVQLGSIADATVRGAAARATQRVSDLNRVTRHPNLW